MGYISIDEFSKLTELSNLHVQTIIKNHREYLENHIEIATAMINARLLKRYKPPFKRASEQLKQCTAVIVSMRVLNKLRIDSSETDYADGIRESYNEVMKLLEEVANGVTGLLELSEEKDGSVSAVSKPNRPFYAEQSPWTSLTKQRDLGMLEERRRIIR